MRIKFLRAFEGRETNNELFNAGDVTTLPKDAALALINMGMAAEEDIAQTNNKIAPVAVRTRKGQRKADQEADDGPNS